MRLTLLAPTLLAATVLIGRLVDVQASESLRLVRGTIGIGSQGPEPLNGDGWSLEVLGTGQYRIWFDDPFPAGVQSRPSVVAQSTTAIAYTVGTSNGYADVTVRTVANLPTDTPVQFVAVGPR